MPSFKYFNMNRLLLTLALLLSFTLSAFSQEYQSFSLPVLRITEYSYDVETNSYTEANAVEVNCRVDFNERNVFIRDCADRQNWMLFVQGREVDPETNEEIIHCISRAENWELRLKNDKKQMTLTGSNTRYIYVLINETDPEFVAGPAPEPAIPEAEPKEVFVVVENMPEFHYKGNTEMGKSLAAYLADSLRWPPSEADAQGNVYVGFIVETDGSLSEIKVLRGLAPAFDEEALRVTGSMPPWQPGMQRGIAVRCRMTVPVRFRIQE